MPPAVLFIIFNRPDTTERVLNTIRQAKPQRLYIAADGPRTDKPGEAEKVQQLRDMVFNGVDWSCQIKTLLRENNLGCKIAVSSAIDWFFEHEEEGIILEDDCLPNPGFFPFCKEMLSRYRYHSNIICINGNHSLGTIKSDQVDYYFSVYPNIWGWATWRRAWNQYDITMSGWPSWKKNGKITEIFVGKYSSLINEWIRWFDETHQGEINTWDYQFVFMAFENHLLSIQPYKNLISNIGYGAGSTHPQDKHNPRINQSTNDLCFPLKHPDRIERSYIMEDHSLIQKTILVRIRRKMAMYFPFMTKIVSLMRRYRRLKDIDDIRYLNIGCGGQTIDEPGWLNIDIHPLRNVYYCDARKKLKFNSQSVEAIYSEHMIEHMFLDEGRFFLEECYRVLKTNGIIRLATPDLFIIEKIFSEMEGSRNYVEYVCNEFQLDEVGVADAINAMFFKHGHKYIYSFEKLEKMLKSIGFKHVSRELPGSSKHKVFLNREIHGLLVGDEINKFETLVVEAKK